MFSFSIILTWLFKVIISIATSSLLLYLSSHVYLHRHPDYPYFLAFLFRLPTFPRRFPAPAFPSHSLHSHSYSPILFHNSSFWFLQIACSDYNLRKIASLVQKRTLSFVTIEKSLAPSYCLHPLWRHQCYHQKLFTLYCLK